MRLFNILIVLVLFVFLIGCGSSNGQSQGMYNFKQGYSGLKYKFFDNAPPQKIYPDSDFKIIVEVDNQAAYNSYEGSVQIIGLDDKYFRLASPSKQHFKTLAGKSLMAPNGEKEHIQFDLSTTNALNEFGAELYNANYFLKISYDSEFDFADTICLDPSLYDVYDAGCKMKNKISYSGQGSPVSVSLVEPILYPAGAGAHLELRAKIKNAGKGKTSLITLNEAKLGGQEIDCVFKEELFGENAAIILKDKQEANLVCETHLNGKKSYETTLLFRFSYDYELKEKHVLKMVK